MWRQRTAAEIARAVLQRQLPARPAILEQAPLPIAGAALSNSRQEDSSCAGVPWALEKPEICDEGSRERQDEDSHSLAQVECKAEVERRLVQIEVVYLRS